MSLIEVQHPIGYNLHPEVFHPSPAPVHFELPAKPTPKNPALAKVLKAQQFGSILSSIGQLPSIFQEQYQKGANVGLQQNLRQRYMQALSSGDPQQLAGFGVGPNGVTYDPTAALNAKMNAPLRQAQLLEAQANASRATSEGNLTAAKIKAMQDFQNAPANDNAGVRESQGVVAPSVPSQPSASNGASLGGALAGSDQTFNSVGQKYGVDPTLLKAIAAFETGNGSSHALKTFNNVGGLMNPSDPSKFQSFGSVDDGIDALGSLIARKYVGKGLTTPEQIGAVYSPPGASNDPNNTNATWPAGVRALMQKFGGQPSADASQSDPTQQVADDSSQADPTQSVAQADPTQSDPTQAADPSQSAPTQADPTQVAQADQSQTDDSQDPNQPVLKSFNTSAVDPGTVSQIGQAASAVGDALASLNTSADQGNPSAQDALSSVTTSIGGGGQAAPATLTNQAAGADPEFFINNQPVQPGVAVSSPTNDALGVSGGTQGGDPTNVPQGATLTQDAFGPGGQLASFGSSQQIPATAQGAVAPATPGTAMQTPALSGPQFVPGDTTATQPQVAQPQQTTRADGTIIPPVPTDQIPVAQTQVPAIHAATGQVKNGRYNNGNGTQSLYVNGILTKVLMMKPDGNIESIDPPKRAVGFPTAQDALADVSAQGLTPTGKVSRNPDGSWTAEGAAMPKLDSVTQKMVADARQKGYTGDITGKTQDQVQADVTNYLKTSGLLNEGQLNTLTRLSPTFDSLPVVRNAQGFIDGYKNAKYAGTDPSMVNGGIGDKTLIEETQKLLNPGGVVSPQTMHMFGATPGLIEKLSPTYISQHYGHGALLTDVERKQLLSIADRAMQSKVDEMDSVAGRFTGLAEQNGIAKEKSSVFFNNPYKEAMATQPKAQATSTYTPAQPAAVNSQADFAALPSGSFFRDSSGKLKQKK